MPALTAALVHGALLCAWMTFIVLGSLRHDPRIWRNDAPKPVQELLGPMSRETRRRHTCWALLMLVGVVGLSVRLMNVGMPTNAGVSERLLAAYVMFELFNLYDAVVLDIGVILLWAPDWAFPAGTRRHPALRDWRFHVRAYLIGVLAGVPFAGLVAGIWAAFRVIY